MEPVVAPVAVTAWQSVSAAGRGNEALRAALYDNLPCLAPIRLFPLPFETVVGEYTLPLPAIDQALQAYACRNARLALEALNTGDFRSVVEGVLERYGPGRVGLVLGTSTSGIYDSESAYAHFVARGVMPDDFNFLRRHAIQSSAAFLALELGIEGPVYAISTACSSSAKALGSAQRLLVGGTCEVVLVAGVDTLCRLTLRGFHSLELVAASPCRPMDAGRQGINIGEAAALLLLEQSNPGNRDCPHLLAVGESSDAHHMSAPEPGGRGAEAAMGAALAMAGLGAEAVDYVNLHATATLLNDLAEARAVARLMGGKIACSGVKGIFGHTLGASGALETVVTMEALREGRLPGTCGLENPDPECPIRILRAPEPCAAVFALCNAFGFGGSNASVLLARSGEELSSRHFSMAAKGPCCTPAEGGSQERREDGRSFSGRPPRKASRRPCRPLEVRLLGWAVCSAEPARLEVAGIEAQPPDPKRLPGAIRRRTSQATRLALGAGLNACQRAGVDPARLPAVFASVGGEMQVTDRLCIELAKADGWISPTQFHNSVHNTAAGYWSIATGCREATTAMGAAEATLAMAWREAKGRLETDTERCLVICYDERWPPHLEPGMGDLPVAVAWVMERGEGGLAFGPLRRDPSQQLPEPWQALVRQAPVVAAIPLLQHWQRRQGGGRVALGGNWCLELRGCR